ncbi:hypothetical protein BDN72DRAFT_906762 [Pluteus cervinus]|uniref:Uncharacterized protein n=1 Tax=Pluteus cervinus TaxID=181527 RepID=A0ACD2ZY73_9AGAR|nr:hypothetical protein BDN72DRAFT_906762 [Pluteus cervinus]
MQFLLDSLGEKGLGYARPCHGPQLLSASIDGRLCIWLNLVRQPSFQVRFVGFLSLAWLDDNTLIAGTEDGRLISLRFGNKYFSATGFDAHRAPLECLGTLGKNVATGTHSEIMIWELHPAQSSNFFESCVPIRQLGPPPSTGHNSGSPVVVTSLQWADLRSEHPGAIFAGYLDHGVVMWDVSTGDIIRSISTSTHIGTVLLSPCGHMLVTANSSSGFDVYHTEKTTPIRKFVHQHPPSSSRLFLPRRCDLGLVERTDDPETVPYANILAISAHFDPSRQGAQDTFFVAVAMALKSTPPSIQIWQTQAVDSPQTQTSTELTDRRRLLNTPILYTLILAAGIILGNVL